MNCERVRELVSDALDGVLPEDFVGPFREHLAGCPPCRTFHANLKESLLLLEELPAVEVREDFDARVWELVRAERAVHGPVESLRARVHRVVESVGLGVPAWRWVPVAAAAALLLFVAISSGPLGADDSAPAFAARDDAPAPASILPTPAEPATSASFGEEEYEAGMPQAVETFLRNARDLRLPANPDRYRRSNYHYPLRRFRDPTFGDAMMPVTGGAGAPSRSVAPRMPSPSEPGVAVFAF